MNIKQRILSLMAQYGYSYRTLADRLGKNHMTVYNWAHGSQIKEVDIIQLAKVLNTTPQWLRYGNKLENHELDTDLIARILRMVSKATDKHGLELPPEKLAALLTTAYDIIVEKGSIDEELVERLLKLTK